MDTTYIKMCDCEEIQAEWEPAAWDRMYCKLETEDEPIVVLSGYCTDSGVYGHGIDEGDECPLSSYYRGDKGWGEFKSEHIWLPYQHQLQEMVDLTWHDFDLLCWAVAWNDGKTKCIPSKEVAGIMAVMEQKYNKTWESDKWIKK